MSGASQLNYSIRAIGTALGERVVSSTEMAATYGLDKAAIDGALGDMVTHATDRPRHELAAEAAQRCLDSGGVSIADVDVLISCSTQNRASYGPPLSHLLGRPQLSSTTMLGTCVVFFKAMRIARAWLRSEGGRRALVVYAETCDGWPRIFRPTGGVPRDVLSDGAAAVLIEAGPGFALRGFGADENTLWWDYFENPRTDEEDESLKMQVMRESVEASKRALETALASANLPRARLDGLILPNESEAMTRFMARHLRVAPERVVRVPHAPSHVWAADSIYNLEHAAARFSVGHHLVCMVRAVGVAGALVLEVVGDATTG